ncbi:hypothetical protein, partial [Pseudomonas quasicaspiana]|uniref:hypothetical protein n=1 Tax=Pseudomonas quasicaspiana TaxID=2829821 RepID=UPI001E3C9105
TGESGIFSDEKSDRLSAKFYVWGFTPNIESPTEFARYRRTGFSREGVRTFKKIFFARNTALVAKAERLPAIKLSGKHNISHRDRACP